MNITLNGEPREIPDAATVADVIDILDLNPRFLAVEHNLDIVPRDRHADTRLTEGDRLEIVTLVGGG